jgi:hypothetical protein
MGAAATSPTSPSIRHSSPSSCGLEAPPNQVVEERLRHGGVLSSPLDHAEGMLAAVTVDADGGQQRKVLFDLDALRRGQKDQGCQVPHPGRHARLAGPY